MEGHLSSHKHYNTNIIKFKLFFKFYLKKSKIIISPNIWNTNHIVIGLFRVLKYKYFKQ
jgi:hypothetical protein